MKGLKSACTGQGLVVLALLVFIPVGLAKGMVMASWLQTAGAFAVFYLVLFIALGGGKVSNEVFGFTLIFGMFSAWLGVPLVALALRALELV
ncbi:hypothetical protein [Qipengyuania flava]|uniref:hypothetical protein n=1 Tax=Qipengyuania flava TaxID=192812 RepID=UPI001C62D1C9|nr:hypothetical protein [Qipengyuania flava]QYJ06581.1 hypothetical protein KUV82_10975 [Qipengyuania flava]